MHDSGTARQDVAPIDSATSATSRVRPTALIAAVALLLAGTRVAADEVLIARSESTTRSIADWKDYFGGSMRELVSRSETTTIISAERNPPIDVAGVRFDLAATSPVKSRGITRTIARPDDPDFGRIEIETVATTARGEIIETRFTLHEKNLLVPIQVGPAAGSEIRPPPRRQEIQGKGFLFQSVVRTKRIVALLVAPTFEDLLAQREIREVKEPGTRMEAGSLRVLSPDGKPIGFYAGDVRVAEGSEFVRPE